MAEYRYYLIPDAMTRAFPEQFGKQTPTEFFDNIADLEKRYHQLREMPYNNERTWNERTRFGKSTLPLVCMRMITEKRRFDSSNALRTSKTCSSAWAALYAGSPVSSA